MRTAADPVLVSVPCRSRCRFSEAAYGATVGACGLAHGAPVGGIEGATGTLPPLPIGRPMPTVGGGSGIGRPNPPARAVCAHGTPVRLGSCGPDPTLPLVPCDASAPVPCSTASAAGAWRIGPVHWKQVGPKRKCWTTGFFPRHSASYILSIPLYTFTQL